MFDRRKPVGKVVALPVDQIEPSPYQARRTFNEEELAGLAASIRENGLLQPVTVRRLGPDRYELIAGERRLRACKLAGMPAVWWWWKKFRRLRPYIPEMAEKLQKHP